jgi:hypothetical protein
LPINFGLGKILNRDTRICYYIYGMPWFNILFYFIYTYSIVLSLYIYTHNV